MVHMDGHSSTVFLLILTILLGLLHCIRNDLQLQSTQARTFRKNPPFSLEFWSHDVCLLIGYVVLLTSAEWHRETR